jgi:hypothetical protein
MLGQPHSNRRLSHAVFEQRQIPTEVYDLHELPHVQQDFIPHLIENGTTLFYQPWKLHSDRGTMQPTSSGQGGAPQDTSIVYLQPLHDRQIRVLALQPGSGDDPLACQLYVVDVDVKDKNLSFEAISYVWGTRRTTESVTCRAGNDGAQFNLSITRNAADALKAFRQPQDERLLCIDSICISQTSRSEKSIQVGMMDSIFARATAVLIWLGREDAVRSPAAGALFQRWADWSQSVTPAEKRQMLSEMFAQPSGISVSEDGSFVFHPPVDFSPSEVEIVLDIFECEWFWRLWCVQELVLAERAFIYWGSVRMTWETISDFAIYAQVRHPSKVAQSGLAGVQNVHMLKHLRGQIKGEARKSFTFSRLLSLTRLHGVTEHHDRIFSLLGLDRKMRGFAPADMRPEELFAAPDYSQKLEDIYLSTAKRLLTREGNLHLLSFVQHGEKIATGSLPSWVPQWHINMHRLITQFDFISSHPVNAALDDARGDSSGCSGTSVEDAHGSGQASHIVGADTLQTKGLLVDTVSQRCDEPSSSPDFEAHWIQTLRQWFRNLVVWLEPGLRQHDPHVSSDQLNDIAFRVFYRTLFGGHLNIKKVFATLRKELPAFRGLIYSADAQDVKSCPTTKEMVVQMCRSRTLLFTVKGKAGIGPECLQLGDSICSLSGAAVPLLMRPHPKNPLRWLLVGETYVNGLAYMSNDYDIAEDFEALHISSDAEEMRAFIAGSKSRVRKDLESKLRGRRPGQKRTYSGNYHIRLIHLSGKSTCRIILLIVELTWN